MNIFEYFKRQKLDPTVTFNFPESPNDTKGIKEAIRIFSLNRNPRIRTISIILQRESRRNQFLVLQVLRLLSQSAL